jgi:hypothetical protein
VARCAKTDISVVTIRHTFVARQIQFFLSGSVILLALVLRFDDQYRIHLSNPAEYVRRGG